MIIPLCAVLDTRIDPLQKRILAAARETPAEQLAALEVIPVAPTG